MTNEIVLSSRWGTDRPFECFDSDHRVLEQSPEDDVWNNLDEHLKRDILSWGELFHDYFAPLGRWTDAHMLGRYKREAPLLAERIRTEVGERYRVHVSLWPAE